MDGNPIDSTRTRQERSRRDLLKAGVSAVPLIITLHAAPAWAATDYTRVAYRYGANAGKCRNPNFQPGSNSPWKKDEFITCGDTRPKTDTKF